MIGPDLLSSVTATAVVPEQVLPYVTTVGEGRPCRFGACIGYRSGNHVVLVGYPLHDPMDRKALADSVGQAIATPGVEKITVFGPDRPPQAPAHVHALADVYYGLALPPPLPRQKLRNLLRRAGRELSVARGRTLTPDHEAMVKRTLDERPFGAGTRQIYTRIPRYLEASPGSLLFSARGADGRLAAFAVGEFGSLSSAFYMFSFRDPALAPPGSADLTLSALIAEAQSRGQRVLNLGLGIHPGVRFFKEKWGAEILFPYVEVTWETKAGGSRFRRLLGAIMGRG